MNAISPDKATSGSDLTFDWPTISGVEQVTQDECCAGKRPNNRRLTSTCFTWDAGPIYRQTAVSSTTLTAGSVEFLTKRSAVSATECVHRSLHSAARDKQKWKNSGRIFGPGVKSHSEISRTSATKRAQDQREYTTSLILAPRHALFFYRADDHFAERIAQHQEITLHV